MALMKDLHGLGARKIGVTSIPPLGCFPAALTQFGFQQKGCVRTINNDVLVFNRKLNSTAATLRKQLPVLKLVVFDVFKPLYDAIMSPSSHGTLRTKLSHIIRTVFKHSGSNKSVHSVFFVFCLCFSSKDLMK